MLAKLALAEGRDAEGTAAAKAAFDILHVTLPPSNRAVVETVEQLRALGADMLSRK